MINTTSERQEKYLFFNILDFEQLKFHAQLS